MPIAIGRRALRAALSILRPRASRILPAGAEASVVPVSDATELPARSIDAPRDAERPETAHPRPPEPPLDLSDTSTVENVMGLPRDVLLWPPQRVGDITDRMGAARFLIDLLRSRPDLRLRFPRALTGGPHGAFADWLAGDGREPLALTDAALDHIHAALGDDVSRPLRQYLPVP